MARPIILGNGSMAVGINNFGLVHDFYFPYVGLENHATSKSLRHRIGVWIDGQFSWLDDGNWQFTYDYENFTLISHISAVNQELEIELQFRDTVDAVMNVLLRRITVVNRASAQRSIRLMMHQGLNISNSRVGDTSQYLPQSHAILHYKGRRAFIFRAIAASGEEFDQFTIGLAGIEGHEGSFRDAEDGELSGNAVEHGSVDSVMRIVLDLTSGATSDVYYFATASTSMNDALQLSDTIKQSDIEDRFAVTTRFWKEWMEKTEGVSKQLPQKYRDSFRKSLLIMKTHADKRGAVIASLDTQMLNYARDAYGYCWPRDAVNVLWPMVRLGYTDELRAFFDFCRSGMHPDGYLMHKYQADRAVGSSWHPYIWEGKPELPIQEDETAAVLFLLGQYQQLTGDDDYVKHLYLVLVRPMANFLAGYIDEDSKMPHASYDLWEERFLTTTYTIGVTYAGLMAAAYLAEAYGYADDAIKWQTVAGDIRARSQELLFCEETKFFHKGFYNRNGSLEFNNTIDMSSFYGAFMFGLFDLHDEKVQQAHQTILNTFVKGEFNGIPRYVHDHYNTVEEGGIGNPWFVTTLWLAQYYLELEQTDEALKVIDWVQKHMLSSGVLSEQVNPATGQFVSVAPLAWSQAEYVSTLLDLLSQPINEVAHKQVTHPDEE